MVGLIVLVVCIIYISIALFSIYKVKGIKKKSIVLLVFILIPTADVIVGKIYFRYLCNTQSGQFVYKAVELEDEYYFEAGEVDVTKHGRYPNIYAIAKGGEVNIVKARVDFDMPFSAITTNQSDLFHITKWAYYIKQKDTGELLSESIAFLYKGGWVENIYNVGGGRRCPDWGNGSLTSLMQATFTIKE
ncbi:MAG: hypothetical protein IIA06_08005 [Proteobacteria bacterium]|nr:hypothetical protein [Pseudomonadota bacterium]